MPRTNCADIQLKTQLMKNPEKHGLVANAWDYKWCSARWFMDNTPKARIKTIEGFKIDSVNVYDDF